MKKLLAVALATLGVVACISTSYARGQGHDDAHGDRGANGAGRANANSGKGDSRDPNGHGRDN